MARMIFCLLVLAARPSFARDVIWQASSLFYVQLPATLDDVTPIDFTFTSSLMSFHLDDVTVDDIPLSINITPVNAADYGIDWNAFTAIVAANEIPNLTRTDHVAEMITPIGTFAPSLSLGVWQSGGRSIVESIRIGGGLSWSPAEGVAAGIGVSVLGRIFQVPEPAAAVWLPMLGLLTVSRRHFR